MEDAAFTLDRLHEAGTKLAERVEALKAVETDRRMRAEHERVLAERDRLAEEIERIADPVVKIAHTVSKIAICDREIGRLNATSTAKFGYVRPVLAGAPPAVAVLFQEGVVWDAFIAVAGLQPPPVVSGGQAGRISQPSMRDAAVSHPGHDAAPDSCPIAPIAAF